MDKKSYQPSKIKTKNWVDRNDDSYGTYNSNSKIKFKSTMLWLSYCDYNDAYIPAKGTISVVNAGSPATLNNIVKSVIFKNCTPFADWIEETDNKKVYNAKVVDVEVMPTYSLIVYSDNYSAI